jgi:O-methyltransferase involved in polyketide biosynthesis
MSKRGVAQKPSQTALFGALRRALAHKQYDDQRFGPDDLAQYFLPAPWRLLIKFKKIRTKVLNELDDFLPGVNAYLIARTAYFDRIFLEALQENIPQIVLLGAG